MGQTTSCFAAKGSEFLKAAKTGDYANASSQLQQDVGFVTSSNLKGWTGLHYAAHHGDLKLLQDIILVLRSQTAEVMLIDQQRKKDRSNPQPSTPAAFIDAQINRANVRGQTPLMLACKHGHAAAVKLLLSEGASPLKEDKHYRKTCLHYAAKAGHHECLQLLLAESTTVESDTGTVPLNTVRVQDASNITQRYLPHTTAACQLQFDTFALPTATAYSS
jgi:ankyrin repeat protein